MDNLETKPEAALTFLGTKLLSATPMSRSEYNEFRGWLLPPDENPNDLGYRVEYLDGGKSNVPGFIGYISWSPAAQFEAAYELLNKCHFYHAIYWLQKVNPLGAIQRTGWNGKGLVVKYITGNTAPGFVEKLPYLAMEYPAYDEALGLGSPLYPNGCTIPWLASQTDILADDWVIIV